MIVAIVLLATVGASVLAGAAFVLWSSGMVGGFVAHGPDAELTVDETRERLESEWGDRIVSLEVRAVRLEFLGSWLPSGLRPHEEAVYVEGRLREPDVSIAAVVSPAYGMDAQGMGLLPTKKGAFNEPLSDNQLTQLIVAYRAETDAPLGGIYSALEYLELFSRGLVSDDQMVTDTRGRGYPVRELWAVTEGVVLTGDAITEEELLEKNREALIFRENPKTGEFVYVATERVAH